MPKVAKQAKKAKKQTLRDKLPKPSGVEERMDELPTKPKAGDMGGHIAMLTDLEMFSMNPEDAMLTVTVKIGDREFKQAMDEVYALKWDNARRRFSREEIAKHTSRCAFYQATFLVAATEAGAELEKLENFFTVWKNEQWGLAEEAIKEARIAEMETMIDVDGKSKPLRTSVGTITEKQIEAQICEMGDIDEHGVPEGRKRWLGWQEKMREAKKNKEMMRGLYQITQNSGSYLQTLGKMYNVEDVAGRM